MLQNAFYASGGLYLPDETAPHHTIIAVYRHLPVAADEFTQAGALLVLSAANRYTQGRK